MSERAKQLSDTITVTGASRVSRCAVGSGDPQRRPGISEASEVGILAEAGKHAPTRVGNNKLEGAIARGIGDEAALRPPAVLQDIVLQFAERTHQPCGQSPGETRCYSRILSMFGPLIPNQCPGSEVVGIKTRQWKYSSAITGARATYHAVTQRAHNLEKHGRLNQYGAIGVGQRGCRYSQLDKRPDPARSAERHGAEFWQPPRDGLPKQIVGCLEICGDLYWRASIQTFPPPRQQAHGPSFATASSNTAVYNNSALGCGFAKIRLARNGVSDGFVRRT
ncbi:hypothetical protein [Methyloceanibacter sp.]|uniref:hypothetical protein n=1 Tax=Methyloceanibacter sp. TaxID=1965321 RepID=UPI002B582CAF|nr:hypothetical protein [Methyloceanibacter sp.]HML91872.1 hypothetical protein [Methyloceanibacter sp.]